MLYEEMEENSHSTFHHQHFPLGKGEFRLRIPIALFFILIMKALLQTP